jgi:dipeptidyl aminopeptidase/acylaminoacyl peptidase
MTAPVRRVPDVVYGEVPGYRPLELDLYLPEAAAPVPVIVHVHGGGWRRGSRRHPLPALGPGFYDDLARQASPVAHASAAAPPVLLMHGAADDLVPPAQSVRLAGALRAAGATVELELVPGATHFWKDASDVPGIVRRSVGFLRALTPGGAGR